MIQENIELRASSLRDPKRMPTFARVGAVAGLGTLAVLGTGAMCSSEAGQSEPTSTLQPTATRELFTPTPEATVTPVPMPPEAQEILRDLSGIKAEPAGIQQLSQSFTTELTENGEEEFDYYNLYSSLWAHYNRTKDEKALSLMEKIEGVIAQKYPETYQASLEAGAYLRLDK